MWNNMVTYKYLKSNSGRRILFVIFRIVYIFPHHLME